MKSAAKVKFKLIKVSGKAYFLLSIVFKILGRTKQSECLLKSNI